MFLMNHYTYIIHSEGHNVLCKGYNKDPINRLQQHNSGECTYTHSRGPWRLVFVKKHDTMAEARREERRLKRQNRRYLDWLIAENASVLKVFLGGG